MLQQVVLKLEVKLCKKNTPVISVIIMHRPHLKCAANIPIDRSEIQQGTWASFKYQSIN